MIFYHRDTEMLTAVYVLISNYKDLYYEQALLSAYSLRLHNKNLRVVILVDDATDISLTGKRAEIRKYVDEVKVVDVPKEYTPKERSRYIKTRFRNYLKGKLVFLDTDTIVSEDISDIEKTKAPIACVLDYHANLDRVIDGPDIRKRVKTIFNIDVSEENQYFNSGVMYVDDVPEVYSFFESWHEYWKKAAFIKGQCFDQPAMLVANMENVHIIKELSGIYNCQILTSIQYLHNARIIHFFNNQWLGKEEFSPFFRDSLYMEVKELGYIPDKTKDLIKECKSAFFSPTYYTCTDQLKFISTLVGATCYTSYRKNSLIYKVLKAICKFRYGVIKVFLKKKK